MHSTTGRRKTSTPISCHSVRRTQSDGRELFSGDASVPQTSIARMDDLHSSRVAKRRVISISRRSPQQLEENFVTRSTPEIHFPCDPVPPSSSSFSQNGTLGISAYLQNVCRQVGQEKHVTCNEGTEDYLTVKNDNATNSLRDKKNAASLLVSKRCRSAFQKQVCHVEMSTSREQGHSAKQLAMVTFRAKGGVSIETLRRLPRPTHQTRKVGREACKRHHNKVQSLSSQLQKRPSCRFTRRRLKCKNGGRQLVLRHIYQTRPHETICRRDKYNETSAIQQEAASNQLLKDSSGKTSSMGESITASPASTPKRGLSGEKCDIHIGAYLKGGECNARVQQLENCPTSSSFNTFVASETLVGKALRNHCSTLEELEVCRNDEAAQNVKGCKAHIQEVSASLPSHNTLRRRAVSCISSGSDGVPQLQFIGGPWMSCHQRVSRSLSWTTGCARNGDTALVPLKESTGNLPKLSLGEPPHLSEVEPVLSYRGSSDEAGNVASIGSTITEANATALRLEVENTHHEPSVSKVFQGIFCRELSSGHDMLMGAISTASSQSPYTKRTQGSLVNIPPRLTIDSPLLGNAAALAPLPHEPGAESRVRPHKISAGLSMASGGRFGQVGTLSEAPSGDYAVPHFPGPHIVRHPHALLLTEGGKRMIHSINTHASGQPAIEPAGPAKGSIWATPRSVLISHLDGCGGYTDGKAAKTGNDSKPPYGRILHWGSLQINEQALQTPCCRGDAEESVTKSNLQGDAANYAEKNPFPQPFADSQQEPSALPSVAQSCPALPTPLHTPVRSQEYTQKDNHRSAVDESGLPGFSYDNRLHTPGARAPRRAFARVLGTLRRAASPCVHSVTGAYRCRGALCYCSGTWRDHAFCHVPVFCNHLMREGVLPVQHHGPFYRRSKIPSSFYLKEEALKWMLHSQRKRVHLLNKQLAIQQQQLEQALQLQQTQFKQTLNRMNFSIGRLKNDYTLRKQSLGLRHPSFSRRRTRTICSQERPFAILQAAAAATAAALAAVGVCEQRAHKLLAHSQNPVFSIGDSAQGSVGTVKSEGHRGATHGLLPGSQQQLPAAKLGEKVRRDSARPLGRPSMNEEPARPHQREVNFQSRESNDVVARKLQWCLASFQKAYDPLNHSSQDSAHGGNNVLPLQLAPSQSWQPSPTEYVEKGQPELGCPMLPRAASEPPCPKLSIGLDHSFPSPGRNISTSGAIDYSRSSSQVEVTVTPSVRNNRSIPAQRIQTKQNASRSREGSSGGRRTEPPDLLADASTCRKRNSMPLSSASLASCRSLSRGSRGSHVESRSRRTAIRSNSNGQRGNIHSETSRKKPGDILLVEGLHGVPGRYRCNAIPMAYHRDPSISIFSQLFEDSFRRQRNLLLLRMQKQLGSISIVRPQRTRGGETLQHRPMLVARALTSHNVTSHSGGTAKSVSSKQEVCPRLGWINSSREALRTHAEISRKPTDGHGDHKGIRGKPSPMEDAVGEELFLCPGSLCLTVAQATADPESSLCMHAATPPARLVQLPSRRGNLGAFVAALEAESLN